MPNKLYRKFHGVSLIEHKIKLPEAKPPVRSYVATKVVGKLLYISGQISISENGELIKGKVGEKEQTIFYKNINSWSNKNKITTFFFEVFDEKWKGGDHPNEVEKHWGLYFSNRKPKEAIK